ncbi:hypothetical protein J2X31_003365 [Flavobacterium arsenatis]|uniref:Right handed beta helix domain-containing protein n=1 Tax=Flavobacterium arsenatis TaxID=1484332 RepID=A0ABU1TTY1_9FLAO|nr:hypothetical protein [Flavobacterium arsenatis]MDR6969335.1 hypothetical protein [Flavobacterium arsenatis]
MRNSIFVLFIGILISLTSCRKDFDFETSNGGLGFSKDTVYLDTVFTNIGSSTYTLMVYNKSDKDIKIPTIEFAKGQNSKYRMTVDGMTGDNNRKFNNVELLAKDSLYIFIETTAEIIDANPTDFLYTDQILFDAGTKQQKVELVTLIQDAYFIYPNRENGIYDSVEYGLDENGEVTRVLGRLLQDNHPENGNEYVWGNDKPYVVYGFATVPNNKILTVNSGARIHFHADSGIIVQNGGTLNVNGAPSATDALENEVIFEGDRLEPGFADVPGQWATVYFQEGSKNHTISHLTIKNALVGLLVFNNFENPIAIDNTKIYNSAAYGILAQHAKIDAYNMVINSNSRGVASLACIFGGAYNFTHCTINNERSTSSHVSVLLTNFVLDGNNNSIPEDLTEANFNNCIIYGSNSRQLLISKDASKQFEFKFDHCLIKFDKAGNQGLINSPEYQFDDNIHYVNNLIARNSSEFKPQFLNTQKNQLMIGDDSAAKDAANFNFSTGIFANDLLGSLRQNPSDIGAYNAVVFPEE